MAQPIKHCFIHNCVKIYKPKHQEYYCQECQKTKNKLYNQDHKDSQRAYSSAYREKNKDKLKEFNRNPLRRFKNSIIVAKRKQLTFGLCIERFIELINMPCYYCNGEMGHKSQTGSGLDRLNNTVGYEPDNVVSCCKICNMIKGDSLTSEETLAAVTAILAVRKSTK